MRAGIRSVRRAPAVTGLDRRRGARRRDARFSHDLLHEAVLATVAEPAWALLDRRAAEKLGALGAQPGRVERQRWEGERA